MDENAQSTTSTGIQDYYNLIKSEHEANNAWSAEQAQKAMDYQTQMSNSAHQREVADLKAAGLNPVLSAGGSGASSGSGMAAQRGDENVTALYGLTKTALDATMKQASAMNNIARAYSSGSGSGYSGSSASNLYGINTGNPLFDIIGAVMGDLFYRIFGVKQSTTAAALNAGSEVSVEDVLKSAGLPDSATSSLGGFMRWINHFGLSDDDYKKLQDLPHNIGYDLGLQEWYYRKHPDERPSYTIYGHGRPVKVVLYPKNSQEKVVGRPHVPISQSSAYKVANSVYGGIVNKLTSTLKKYAKR